jgi:hypothetical protein
MLSTALQQNAEHEARLSNISDCSLRIQQKLFEILRFAQDDSGERTLDVRIEVQKWIYPSNNFLR